jgi:hypothetical protein
MDFVNQKGFNHCYIIIIGNYYYQYNVYMYDLCIFLRYLVSITQVLKDT